MAGRDRGDSGRGSPGPAGRRLPELARLEAQPRWALRRLRGRRLPARPAAPGTCSCGGAVGRLAMAAGWGWGGVGGGVVSASETEQPLPEGARGGWPGQGGAAVLSTFRGIRRGRPGPEGGSPAQPGTGAETGRGRRERPGGQRRLSLPAEANLSQAAVGPLPLGGCRLPGSASRPAAGLTFQRQPADPQKAGLPKPVWGSTPGKESAAGGGEIPALESEVKKGAWRPPRSPSLFPNGSPSSILAT